MIRPLKWLNGAAGASVPAVSATTKTVTNRVPGTRLFIGDGRALAFGESADVAPDIAAIVARHNEQAPS